MQIFLNTDPFLDKPKPSAMPDWDARRRFGVFFVGVSGLLWPVLCGLRAPDFWQYRGRRLGMGDGPVRRGHTGECCGGAPAGNRDAWSSCHSALQRRVAPCRCVQKGATTRSCRNVPMHGIASARRARPWIPYGPSERSGRAPQSGQRSWQACMSVITCPHTGHLLIPTTQNPAKYIQA